MEKNQILVEVDSPFIETSLASDLINKLIIKNKIKLKLSIAYDFNSDFAGLFQSLEHANKPNFARIYINPNVCKKTEDVNNEKYDEPYCLGYSSDLTIFGTTIHEFCHVLQLKVYPTIIKDFIESFPIERFYLTNYCNNDIVDEMAEIMTLYITNPYLLKLISIKHYKFFKKYFKSPIACSKEKCFKIFKVFPKHVKKDLKERWKIVFNFKNNRFQHIK
jgi:hypothetical protein